MAHLVVRKPGENKLTKVRSLKRHKLYLTISIIFNILQLYLIVRNYKLF